MKILVTGANGFIGKNLTAELENRGFGDILRYDVDTPKELLTEYTRKCDFIFHLAGVNRPKDTSEFMKGNFGFTEELLNALKANENRAPIIVSSSIQASLNNPYGESKKAGEELLFRYSQDTGARVYVYRLPNVFGKWCRPNYNSVVATFCHNIAHGLEIKINDPKTRLELVYIDDVVNEFISTMLTDTPNERSGSGIYHSVPVTHSICLSELADTIRSFRDQRTSLFVPDQGNELYKKLYSTYLSYLPTDSFSYELNMHKDDRGSFTEFLKTAESGQVSVNVIKPGITKGNHWHHSKNEKFLVVKGEGLFRFRKHGAEEIIEYRVSGDPLKVVDIPTGYTHSIVNVGNDDMVVIIWANEVFDPKRPDTYFEEV
ncbi:MAG: capsular polysaccharide biosynthesis protein CapF [Lachnospiraceae bacterium]|nr:capsular polysaccharide biosynthesis protein CapF [Lachnospiraceae bacterium]